MALLFTNLKIVLLVLLLLNAALVFFLKNPLRFVKGPLILFGVLTLAFLTYRFIVFPATNRQIQKEKEIVINKSGWEYVNDPELDAAFITREQNNKLVISALFRIVGFQTVAAFVLAAVGIFISNDKKIYGLYALGFLVLAFLFLT